MSNTKQAANLLIWTKTRLGRKVPDYPKKILADKATASEQKRAPTELLQTLSQIRDSDRKRLFVENPKLEQWFASNQVEEKV